MGPQLENAALILLVLQALWGLFLMILGFSVRRLLKDLESNTAATSAVAEKLSALNLSLLTNFVLKEDWVYIRQRMHDLGDQVNGMKAREELRERMDQKGKG